MAAVNDFESFQRPVSEAIIKTTRTATRIAAEDLRFHRSLNPSLGTLLDQKSARLLSLTEKLIRRSAASATRIRLRDVDDIDPNFRTLVDVADGLLERVDTCLDEFTGLVKRTERTEQEDVKSSACRRVKP